ncbi:MAG TPA: LacI family DNA-binding transcriptional regulator [Candidatus Nanopelagicaceae bacterium]|jgi:LacI family transcriptional regulator
MASKSPSARQARVTINEVASEAGVSRSTTSRVLGGYGIASEEARERVLEAAKKLNYRPNALARAMITGKTFTIGVVLGDIENSFFARLARGVADGARAGGFEILLSNTDEDIATEIKAIRILQDRQVDGFIVAATSMQTADHLQAIKRNGIPLVLVDRLMPNIKVDTVAINNRVAAGDAAKRLLEAGHRHVGVVTGAHSDDVGPIRFLINTGQDRVEGFRETLVEAGIELDPKMIRWGAISQEAARAQTRILLAFAKRPTAIFATDSLMALGVLQGVHDSGLRSPDDVSVVGFDDADWTEVITPRLSVVAQPVHEIGRLAAERLLARINGDTSRSRTYLLPTTWIERDSIASPRRRGK